MPLTVLPVTLSAPELFIGTILFSSICSHLRDCRTEVRRFVIFHLEGSFKLFVALTLISLILFLHGHRIALGNHWALFVSQHSSWMLWALQFWNVGFLSTEMAQQNPGMHWACIAQWDHLSNTMKVNFADLNHVFCHITHNKVMQYNKYAKGRICTVISKIIFHLEIYISTTVGIGLIFQSFNWLRGWLRTPSMF